MLSEPFLRYGLIVVAAPGHTLASSKGLAPAALVSTPWLLGPYESERSTDTGAFLARQSIAPRRTRAYPNFAAALAQVASGRGDDDQPVAQKRLGQHRRHVLAFGDGRAERDVGGAVGEQRGVLLAARDLQVDLDPRVAVAEHAQQRPGRELRKRRRRGDAQRRLLRLGLAHRVTRLLGETEDLAGRAGQPAAARRPLADAARPDVERVAELPTQCSNRARYRRLGDLERPSSRLHRAQAGDGYERSELREGQLSERFI
jgi:hypothetical protein